MSVTSTGPGGAPALAAALQHYDSGILTLDELFGRIVDLLEPSRVPAVFGLLVERGWVVAFTPWLLLVEARTPGDTVEWPDGAISLIVKHGDDDIAADHLDGSVGMPWWKECQRIGPAMVRGSKKKA